MTLPSGKTSTRPSRPPGPRCRGGVSSVLRLAPASSSGSLGARFSLAAMPLWTQAVRR